MKTNKQQTDASKQMVILMLLVIPATIMIVTTTTVQARTQGDVEYDQGYNSGIRDGQSAALSGSQFNDHGCLSAGNSGSYCLGYKVGYRIGFSGSQLLN
jgi:hypothetical protein